WELAGTEQASGVRHERRNDLGVAMFPCVDVEHEINKRPFQARAHSSEQRKSGTGDLCGTFEIENSERGDHVPMRFRFEFETGDFADAAHLDVLVFGQTDGNYGIRQIRHRGDELEDLLFYGPQRIVFVFDLLRYSLHFIAFLVDIDLLSSETRNFFRTF